MRGLILRTCLVAEIEALHHARPELLDQHIRFLKKRPQAAAIALILQVEHEALLAPVEQREHRRLAVEARRHRAHVLAARPLDLDHLGAGFRQHQGRERPRQQRGEIEDEDAGERLDHGVTVRYRPRPSSSARWCGTHRACARLRPAPCDRGDQPARRAHDVDAVRQHRDAQAMAEVGVAHAP